jgi:hypothetical protein
LFRARSLKKSFYHPGYKQEYFMPFHFSPGLFICFNLHASIRNNRQDYFMILVGGNSKEKALYLALHLPAGLFHDPGWG